MRPGDMVWCYAELANLFDPVTGIVLSFASTASASVTTSAIATVLRSVVALE
jgi:hypothetical protein